MGHSLTTRCAGAAITLTALAALGCGIGAAPARAATAAPRAAVTRIACHSTLVPSQRSVSVTSVMRHRPGTRSMAVRFTLIEQAPGSPPTRVSDGDLGRWLTPSDPTLGRLPADVWKLTRAVYNVDAPARYRFRVTFRWTGRHHAVILTQTLRTGRCAERDLRPDVLIRGVRVHPIALNPTRDRYVAVVANRGGSASGPFLVQFTPGGGGPNQEAQVGSLVPGAQMRVAFVGPACDAAAPPTIVADPTDQVDDSNRSNNTFTVRCPPSVAAALPAP